MSMCRAFALLLVSAAPAAAGPPNLALLVGCTKYPNNRDLIELWGPANDVPMWADLLTDADGFAFPKENVTRLTGWPADAARRPTRANIVQAFRTLIAKAGAGSRVVVVLSGHGVQVPIPESQKNPLDKANPEPDGLDEVFLPADVGQWAGRDGLTNALTDDEIGGHLRRLRDKGAHVLAVFDCCHSGTMTRGGHRPGNPEVSRVADPKALGVTPEMLDRARGRAGEAVAVAKQANRPIPSDRAVRPAEARGSLVAFYAAQPFEEAPELPRPEGAAVARKNYYGMLSFTLVRAMRQRRRGLSYGELQRLVAADYVASRASRPPTPFAEGDLNREVLGLAAWPVRDRLYLRADRRGRLTLEAGALHGMTVGSVLAVKKLGTDAVLGHVRVSSVRPAAAAVTPAASGDKPALPARAVRPNGVARCELVSRRFGDMRVKIFTDSDRVKQALAALPDGPKGMMQLVAGPRAEWKLIQSCKEFRLVGGDKVFARYPLAARGLQAGLARDVPKIFTWQNVWRVADGVSSAEGGETHGLELEVVKLTDPDAVNGERLRGGRLADGQDVLFRAVNGGRHDLWVSAFYLDANLGIQALFSGGVGRGRSVELNRGTMDTLNGTSVGREGVVLFAVPQSISRPRPMFDALLQEPLRADVSRAPLAVAPPLPQSPFGRLLAGAALKGGPVARAFRPRVKSTPAILTQTWVLTR